jgi:hypothetical protein
MQMLFKGFPEECDTLKPLKDGALSTGSSSKWSTEWEACALPLVNQVRAQTWLTKDVHCIHQISLTFFHIQFAGHRIKHMITFIRWAKGFL